MRKNYCDKCGKEINLILPTTLDQIYPCTNGGNFQYNLAYSFDASLSLHGVEQENEFDKSLDLCITCALKLIKLIEDVDFHASDKE